MENEIAKKFQKAREDDIFYPEDLKEGGPGSGPHGGIGTKKTTDHAAELHKSEGLSQKPTHYSTKEAAFAAVKANMHYKPKAGEKKSHIVAVTHEDRHYTMSVKDGVKLQKKGAEIHKII